MAGRDLRLKFHFVFGAEGSAEHLHEIFHVGDIPRSRAQIIAAIVVIPLNGAGLVRPPEHARDPCSNVRRSATVTADIYDDERRGSELGLP
ncbi:MAG: hypothetical protein ABIS14_10365, partial [Sphingomonas sp.]